MLCELWERLTGEEKLDADRRALLRGMTYTSAGLLVAAPTFVHIVRPPTLAETLARYRADAIAELKVALEAGGWEQAPCPLPGTPWKVESLEAVLANVTYEPAHLRLPGERDAGFRERDAGFRERIATTITLYEAK